MRHIRQGQQEKDVTTVTMLNDLTDTGKVQRVGKGRGEKIRKQSVREIGVKIKDLIVACSFTGLVEKLNLPDLEL